MAKRVDNKNMLAYYGKSKRLIRVLTITESGAIAQYEVVGEEGIVYMPLIENGKNVEEIEIIGEQTTLF